MKKNSKLLVSGVLVCGVLLLLASASLQDGPRVHLERERVASINNDGGALRVEPSVALHHDLAVVAWNDSWGGRHGARTGVVIGWAVRTGGEQEWQFQGYLPNPDIRPTPGGADSRIAFDNRGAFYLLVLSWTAEAKALRVFRGIDDRPNELRELAVVHETVAELIDKPDLEVAGEDRLFVAFTGSQGIAVVQSADGGVSWSNPILISDATSRTRSGVAIAAAGEHLVAMWHETGADTQEVWAAQSSNGGASFGAPQRVHALEQPVSPLRGYALGVGPAGHMASDIGLAVHDGRFYAVFIEPTDAGSLLRMVESADGGHTWTVPSTVGRAGMAPKAFPSLAILAGQPAVLYYDRRLDARDDTSTDVFLSVREPDGQWIDQRITSVSTRWDQTPGDREHAMVQRNFGDYITLAADGDRFVAAWTDGRDGVPRIYTRRGWVSGFN